MIFKEPPRVEVQEQQQDIIIKTTSVEEVKVIEIVEEQQIVEEVVEEVKIISPCKCEIDSTTSNVGKCMCEIIQEQQRLQNVTFEELAADATGEPVNGKLLDDELKTSEDEVSIVSSAFAEQLENVQKQLMALSHLPKTIQSTLDDISKQLQSLIPTKQKSVEPETMKETVATEIIVESTTEGELNIISYDKDKFESFSRSSNSRADRRCG